MAENDRITRARKLLMNPKITAEDRELLYADFPSLREEEQKPLPGIISTPKFLEEHQEETGIDIQTPHKTGEITAAEVPSLRTQQVEKNVEDLSYSALKSIQDSAEIEKADYQPDNQNIRNLTKRASLYADAEPKVNADNPTVFSSAYFHIEPSLNEVKKWAARTGNKSALEALDKEGEESNVYKEYADIQWKKVRSAFASSGEPAVRLSMLDPESATDWYLKLTGMTGGAMIPFGAGYDDAMTFGIGKQLLSSYRTPSKAEDELVKSGVLRPFSERLEGMQEESPWLSLAGTIYGFTNPLGAGKTIAKLGMKAVEKSAKPLMKYLVPFLEGSAIGGATETIRKIGKESRQEDAPTIKDIGTSALLSGTFGGLMGGAAEMVGTIGKAKTRALRQKPGLRENLARMELGSPAERGGTTMKPFSGGVKPHEQYGKTAKKLSEERALAIKEGRQAPPPISPTTKIADDASESIRGELTKLRTDTHAKINAMKEPYYRSTENVEESIEPLGRSILEMIQKSSKEGWDFPWSKNEMMRRIVNKLGHRVQRIDGTMTWVWRKFNPRELDEVISNLDDALNMEAAKYSGKKIPSQLATIQKNIRDIRDKFPANEYAPDSMVEVVNIGGKQTQIRGGLSALNAKAHKMMNKVRNAEYAIGLKNVLDEPDILKQKVAIINRAKEWGLEHKTPSDDALRELFRNRPDIIRALDSVGSGEAFETFQRNIGKSGITGRTQGSAPALWATSSIERLTGTYADPLFMAMSQLGGKGSVIGSASATREKDFEFVPAFEHALRNSSAISNTAMDNIELLWKLYKDATDRGILDEIKRQK